MAIRRPALGAVLNPPYPPLRLSFAVWGLGGALYLIAFFQRVAPAVITVELMSEFALGAAALGNLSAFYFYSYVAMQIPTGVLVDHWGPRRVLTAGAGIAALGTFLFALTPSFALVGFGRLLIGASVGVAFVAMMKLSTHWFHPSRFAAISGLALTCGIVGAVSAGAPLRMLVDGFGWRAVMIVSGIATAALAVVTWVIVRDDPSGRGYRSYMRMTSESSPRHSMLGGIRHVLRYRNIWMLFLSPGGVAGPALAFSGLWGVPFLTTHYAVTTAQAALMTSALLIAWAVGGPLVGAASDRIGRRKPLLLAGFLTSGTAWAIVFLIPSLPIGVLIALLLLIGFSSSVIIVGFAFAKESVPVALAGTSTGFANMGTMAGGMVLQPAVGWMLDRSWDGTVANGVRIYGFDAYQAGFALMLIWTVASLVLVSFTRETYCRQHE